MKISTDISAVLTGAFVTVVAAARRAVGVEQARHTAGTDRFLTPMDTARRLRLPPALPATQRQLVTTVKKLVERLLKLEGSSWVVLALTSRETLERKDVTHTIAAIMWATHITDWSMVEMLHQKISLVRYRQLNKLV
jgi:hypothetical protein